MGTYINDTLEGAKNSGDRAQEDALQKARLANDDVEQVLVNNDELPRGLTTEIITSKARHTSWKASQTCCSAAVSV